MSTAPDQLPEPGSAPPPPTSSSSAPKPLRELLSQVVDVAAVEIVEGIPLVLVGSTFYVVPQDDWAERCATALQGELATNGGIPLSVRVVEHEQEGIGFAKPDDGRYS